MAKRKTILGIPKCGQPTSCAPSAPLGCSHSTIWRDVFLPRNSTCGSAKVEDLCKFWWRTDNSSPDSIYIHAERLEDRTYHRVWPRPIRGHTCRRIGMRNRFGVAKLFWIYDVNPTLHPPGCSAAEPR